MKSDDHISYIPPAGDELLKAFISLSHELQLTMSEEELIRLFVGTFEELFPNRMLCIRLFNRKGVALGHVYANGRLAEEAREKVFVTREACEEQGFAPNAQDLEDRGIYIEDNYKPVVLEGACGFDVLMYDGSTLFGIINFEYKQAGDFVTKDRLLAVPLVHQMCAALRNARLHTETILLKDYLEKLLDRANAPVLVIDKKRRITVVNQAFERQTGYDRKQILQSDFDSLISREQRARLLPVVLSAIRGDSTSNFEVRIPRADGNGEAHMAFNTAVMLSRYGEPDGVILVGQDLTEIHALQRQVIHSEKLATLGQVTAGVVHELNNPLTSISVYSDYLSKRLSSVIDEADLAKLRRISDSADRIQTFTRNLVAYARPSSEEPAMVRVLDLLERTLSFCEHIIADSEADIVLEVADDLKPLYGIRGQLEQVFVNLITNACHSLPDSGGAIRIEAQSLDDERVEISVADTGQGIASERVKDIFEPFFSTKPEGLGTGLGLSIVHNILVNHNAEISVESTIGEGSKFTVVLFTR